MEVFDKDGNPVENVMTAEQVAEKIAAAKKEWEEKNKPPVAAPVPPPSDEPPAWFKPFAETVNRLATNQQSTIVADVVSAVEADKRELFNTKFNNLTGYPETPEGLQARARDAYVLTTGQPYNAPAVNMQNIVAANGRPVIPQAPKGEVNKEVAAVFGISEEDVKKYG